MVTLVLITSVVLVSVFVVPSLSQEDDSCQLPTDPTIRVWYEYNYFDIPGGATGIEFKVKANNNAVIAISPPDVLTNGYYKIVIGEEDDTQSSLRHCRGPIYCPTLTYKATDNFLDPGEFHRFWIKFGNKDIEVGRWNEGTAFMDFEFDAPMSFEYLGYLKKNSAEYLFCNFVYDSELSSPLPSVTSSSLNVSSSSEAHSPMTSSFGGYSSDTSSPSSSVTSSPPPTVPSLSDAYNPTISTTKGNVALWPLAAVCVIPLVGAVVIYVIIRRKKKGSTGQAGELPNSVIEDRPDKISSTFQNGTYEYARNGETPDHSADTAMVDNVAYQAADEFSNNRNDVNLGGESVYNAAYESYGKTEGDVNSGVNVDS